MDYKIIEKDEKKYIKVESSDIKINSEETALDLIALCLEHDVKKIILNDKVLSDDFFSLKTGLAGAIVQKLVNYNIKTGIIISDKQKINGRFKEFTLETNKGNTFKIFENSSDAEKWILIS